MRYLILFVWTLMTSVYAESADDLLQKKLASIHTMHAHFSQTVRSKQKTISISTGTMALAKPNQFRWHTQKPMEQTVIADGKKLWLYDVDLEQVTVSKQTRSLGAAGALFLSQDSDVIRRDFKVNMYQKGASEFFDLYAKSTKVNFERVRVIFVNNILKTIELNDQLGQKILIDLTHVVINQPESPALFHFRIPKGVDVVQQ